MQHWHHLLDPKPSSPHRNVVQVSDNLIDLSEAVISLLAHKETAERVANNSASIFRDRYLTPAATACYWRELFRAYARAQNFDVQLTGEEVPVGEFIIDWKMDD